MCKRYMSILLALCLLLSLVPVNVLAVEWPQAATRVNVPQRGDDAPQLVDGYYEIYNADQLYWFAEQVNGGSTTINGKLMADIVVNENVLNANGGLNGDSSNFRAWMPIGEERAKAYKGIFDGNGKTISGLYFNDSTKSNVGLFGYVEEYGKVLNVGVVGSWFSGYYYVGGVVGVNYGLVGNSYNTGSVSGSGNYIGGVVSFNSGSCAMVQNCYNTGSVSGSGNYVGGVVSINYGSCAMVQNCYNTGDVIGGGSWSGGVVGFNALFDSNSCGTISHCFNTGNVNGSICAGGVVGTNSGTVSNCYNVGSICGNSYIGGVVGYITNGTINNCFNDGNVSSSSFSVGGVAGYNYSSDAVINCYYLFGCAKDGSNKVQYGIGSSTQGNTTADISGETTGKITTQFTSGEVAFLLGEAFGQSIGTDTYPILFGAKVYRNQVGGCNASSYVFEYSNTQMTAMTTHNWAAATCTEPKTCTVCGATTGTALGHNWKAATCTKPKTCNRCGLTEGNPLGHKWSDATCTAPKTCTTCGATTGKALGHIEVVIPGYAATYEAPGLTDGSYCSRCGDTLQEHAVIDPIPEEVFFSYKAYGINGSTNAVNSGYITVEIWMNVNSDFARVWGADIGLSFNQNLTLLDIQGGIFEEALATPLNIANAYNAVKMTQDMVLGDDKTFQQGQYLFATLTFKVDKNFHSQNAAFLVDVDECSLIRKGEFANELVTDFGTGTNIYISKLGDANLDGKISAADTMALSSWLQNADLDDYNAVFDLNKDGYIDGDDFALLRGAIVWDNGYLDI